jgi:cobalt-precorrin 5A hydrolase
LYRLREAGRPFRYRALLTNRRDYPGARPDDLYLRPPNLYVGVGCRRGTAAERILSAIGQTLETYNLAGASVAGLASIEGKKDEAGLLAAADVMKVPLHFYPAEEINALPAKYQVSAFVDKTMGVGAVCEPTAMLAARSLKLLVPKQKTEGITVAVAEAEYPWSDLDPAVKRR